MVAGERRAEWHAFREALESYQQLCLLEKFARIAQRDRRELELRQSVVEDALVTKGINALNIRATERAAD